MNLRFAWLPILSVCALLALCPAWTAPSSPDDAPLPALPLLFQRNQGLAPGHYSFFARQGSVSLGFRKAGFVTAYPDADHSKPEWIEFAWEGFQPESHLDGDVPSPTMVHYIPGDGSTGASSRTSSTYTSLRQRDAFPGIDIVYRTHKGNLEYDLHVAPGANLRQVVLRIEGARSLRLTPEGDLEITSTTRTLIHRRPVLFQEIDGQQHPVSGAFTLLSENRVSIASGEYRSDLPLVVDPIVETAVLLGSTVSPTAYAGATDSLGNTYLFGLHNNPAPLPGESSPRTALPFTAYPGSYVAKINADLKQVEWVTYFGGVHILSSEFRAALAPDANGSVVLAFTGPRPTTISAGPYGSPTAIASVTNRDHVNLVKFAPDGSQFEFATYFTCNGFLQFADLQLSSTGEIWLAMNTANSCTDFPTTNGAYRSAAATDSQNIVAARVAANGSSMPYAALLGGSKRDIAISLRLDPQGRPVVMGTTWSEDFSTTADAHRRIFAASEAFASKLSLLGNQLEASTFVGGSSDDLLALATIDAGGSLFLLLSTQSNDIPVSPGAFQSSRSSGTTAVVKLNPNLSGVAYATYFASLLSPRSLRVDSAGNALVLANTDTATNLPITTDAILRQRDDETQGGYLARLDASGSVLTFGTLLHASRNGPFHILQASTTRVTLLASSFSTSTPPLTDRALIPATAEANPRGLYLLRLNLADPTACTYSFESEFRIPKTAGIAEFPIASQPGCPWLVRTWSGDDVFQFPDGNGGFGSASLRIAHTSNPTTNERHLSFSVNLAHVSVRQDPATCDSPSGNPSYLQFAATGGARTVALSIPSGCPWGITNDVPWVTTDPPGHHQGYESRSILISVPQNSFGPRNGVLRIAGIEVPVAQDGGSCTATLTPATVNLPASGGSTTFALSATGQDCSWQVHRSPRLQIAGPGSGVGNAQLAVSVGQNPTNVPLTETIYVAGRTASVIQEPGACDAIVSPALLEVTRLDTSANIYVSVGAQTGNCAYFPRVNVRWVRFLNPESSGSGVLVLAMEPNSTGADRTATITLLGQTVTLIQSGIDTTGFYIAGPTDVTFLVNGVPRRGHEDFRTPVGVPLTVVAPAETVTEEGFLFAFQSWIGGPSTLSVTVTPSANESRLLPHFNHFVRLRTRMSGNVANDGSSVSATSSSTEPARQRGADWFGTRRPEVRILSPRPFISQVFKHLRRLRVFPLSRFFVTVTTFVTTLSHLARRPLSRWLVVVLTARSMGFG